MIGEGVEHHLRTNFFYRLPNCFGSSRYWLKWPMQKKRDASPAALRPDVAGRDI
jgi:hypothetical protein